MARLQDFSTVTPTDSDKLLIVQSAGQGLAGYADTIGRKTGYMSVAGTALKTWSFPSTTAVSWVATADCWVVGKLISGTNNSAYINVGNITCGYAYAIGNFSLGTGVCIPVKKGQQVTVGRGDTNSDIRALPML